MEMDGITVEDRQRHDKMSTRRRMHVFLEEDVVTKEELKKITEAGRTTRKSKWQNLPTTRVCHMIQMAKRKQKL